MPAIAPRRFTVLSSTLACLVAAAASASAQTGPAATVSSGYALVADGDLAMPGFYVEGERRLTRMVSAVGQLHRATGSGQGYFSTIDWTDLFVGGGVRVSGRPAPWFEPYGHVLVGSYQVKTVETATSSRFGVGTNDRYTDSSIATLIGGGATLMAAPNVGFRLGGDLQFHPGALPTARVVLGVAVGIGRR